MNGENSVLDDPFWDTSGGRECLYFGPMEGLESRFYVDGLGTAGNNAVKTAVQAQRIKWRSITLVPVEPVVMRSPSSSK